MSISTALNTAMSGLGAAGRASEIVSGNIANAMNEGYARRSLELATQSWTGPGVRIVGVVRHTDPVVIADRRGADAETGSAQTLAGFQARLAGLFGTPEDGDALTGHLNRFETTLIEAAARPESAQRLDSVARAAAGLAAKFNAVSDGVQQLRRDADAEIAREVGNLNTALTRLREVNVQISSRFASGGDTAALLDRRQQLVDSINQLVPVREVPRDRGQIGLMTQGGLMLIDGPEVTLDFQPTNPITPYQTLADGHLAGLQIGDRDLSPGMVAGGRLAALFEVRDEVAVAAQARLDAAAGDIVQRFEAPGLDPTTAVGAPGLFTDDGAAFDTANLTGMATRLAVNPAVDPGGGGQSWRLRDGLGAAIPGAEGDATLLQALAAALDAPRPVSAPGFATGPLTAAQIGSDMMSRAGMDLSAAEERLSFASARQTELKSAELALGVDTDAELKTLMTVEQAYAANARVIQVVEELMDILLRL